VYLCLFLAPPQEMPRYCKSFVSDAAGYSDKNKADQPGVATVGFSEDGKINFAFQKFWAPKMINSLDYMGKNFGHKTAFLELIGLLVPMILKPCLFKNQHVVMKVDNMSCYYGWINRNMSNDEYSSIVLRCMHLVATKLCCVIHVDHLPRMSSWESRLVDRLSRKSSSLSSDIKLVESFNMKLPAFLENWLDSPTPDWNIPLMVLQYIDSK